MPFDEPKFVVFYSTLVSLFSLFCFNCRSPSPGVTVKKCGTMATVIQLCAMCGPKKQFSWRSQPYMLGRYPAGNLLLSFSILMSGVNISKVLLMFRHMGLCVISARTYFVHQNKLLFPAIIQYWEKCRETMLQKLKGVKEVLTWCGMDVSTRWVIAPNTGSTLCSTTTSQKLFTLPFSRYVYFQHHDLIIGNNCTTIYQVYLHIT